MIYKTRDQCRVCGSRMLNPVIDLGNTPLADRFVESASVEEESFPLRVAYCRVCHLLQLMEDIDNEILFADNYGFYTGASPSSVAYFKKYAKEIMERFPVESKEFTMEIASNDGTLLKHFQDAGCRILGVDPARNVAEEANKNGVLTVAEFFNKRFVDLYDGDKPKLILANNVIAHTDTLQEFVDSVERILSKGGVFVFECQYIPNLIFKNEFDHIYHEHRSFFSLHPLMVLMRKFDLDIFDVEEKNVQGGSIRVYVCHKGERKINESVKRMIQYEEIIGITSEDIYDAYFHHITYLRCQIIELLKKLKKEGKKVVGYGASAKSNTMIHYCGIDNALLPYIVDKTPYKIGKYTPGVHIPIVDDSDENTKDVDYYLLFVWNYFDGIVEREKKFRDRGGKFIIPIPIPFIV